MPITTPKELFVAILSNVRHGTERTTKIFEELGEAAQNPEIKEALNARVFVSQQIIGRLDECFRLIGEKPLKANDKFQDVFVEDFRRELAEIQSPVARKIFALARASAIAQMRIGEYVSLIAAADLTGHPAVGALLETCLADKLAFMERTKHMIREHIQQKVAAA